MLKYHGRVIAWFVFAFLVPIPAHAGPASFDTWKFHYGDHPAWAQPEFDDRQWPQAQIPGRLSGQPLGPPDFRGWLRVRLQWPVSADQPAVWGLSLGRIQLIDEVYLNGVRVGGEGRFGDHVFRRWSIYNKHRVYRLPSDIIRDEPNRNVLAIRLQGSMANGIAIEGPVILGNYLELLRQGHKQNLRQVGIEAACLTIGGVFFLLWGTLWINGQRNREHMWFGVLLGLILVTIASDTLLGYRLGWNRPPMQGLNGLAYGLLAIASWHYFLAYLGVPQTRITYLLST